MLGHTNPDWIVGLNNTFTYKNFDLSVFAMARYGQTINSDLLGYYTAEQSVTTNQLAGADYWTENNQELIILLQVQDRNKVRSSQL